MSSCGNILDLPLDILLLIFPYLDARSFLSLTGTCTAFRRPDILFEPSYWSLATQSTFRVPNRPVVQADGKRWYSLYKRLLTQSKVYTWGQNARGCLGHDYEMYHPGADARIWGIPSEMSGARDIGIIADLQCGGWSTTLLNNMGELHFVGRLNGQRSWDKNSHLKRLTFPATFSKAAGEYNADTAICQFSSGRMQIVGIADSGCLWLWHNDRQPALRLKFLHHDVRDGSKPSFGETGRGRIRKVVAGWSKNSALVAGTGIIIWGLIESPDAREESVPLDAMLLNETAVVPNTAYVRPKRNQREADDDARQAGETVGEVSSYILLENYALWVTDLHRVFFAKINDLPGSVIDVPCSLELLPLQRTSTEDKTPCVTDVHGTFKKFALLKSTGEVLVVDQAFLDACWEYALDRAHAPGNLVDLGDWRTLRAAEPDQTLHSASPGNNSAFGAVACIPALQNSGVIAMAFGDWHFHALHSSGSITSYGHEPEHCGALGLGAFVCTNAEPSNEFPFKMLRGVVPAPGRRGATNLLPHAYTKGREVWFQQEKFIWLMHLVRRSWRLPLAFSRQSHRVMGEVSEWVEQKGRGWDKREGVKESDPDGLGAHFVLSVAAAGWHSGALVLVNEDLERKVAASCIVEEETIDGQGEKSSWPGEADWLTLTRYKAPGQRYVWANDGFPRLRLSDGTVLQTDNDDEPEAEWPEGRPDWDLSIEV